jgi:hypothetical protein
VTKVREERWAGAGYTQYTMCNTQYTKAKASQKRQKAERARGQRLYLYDMMVGG